jgi:methylmalonyl-CoA/ethylmalonyl-CoA epimerase
MVDEAAGAVNTAGRSGGIRVRILDAMTHFDHIAIAVPRVSDATAVLTGVLGGVLDWGALAGPYRFAQWRFADDSRLEILEPAGRDGFLHRFLAQRGPGVHHVTFKVPSLAEACGRAQARGFDIVGHDDSNPGWQEAFLHPRQAQGIVVQFAASAPGPAGDGRPPRWLPPDWAGAVPPAVRIAGLRLRARSAERADRLWAGVAGGQASAGPGGERLYRWPGSPMRLAVEVAPEADEGPVAVEIQSPRPLPLPEGPHPVLGVALLRDHSPN